MIIPVILSFSPPPTEVIIMKILSITCLEKYFGRQGFHIVEKDHGFMI
jgi:hypothetical protein